MDLIITRYRNLTVLLAVIAAQLLLLAYQVKSGGDMRLLRVWSVTAIAPMAKLVEGVRAGTVGFFKDYFILLNAREENRKLKEELTTVKIENQFLKTELSTADRARTLIAFASRTPSRTLGARIIANATGANSKVVFVDRGTDSGVQPGMAVITPDGIVGKVIAVYRNASQVMLITDSSFAAGVITGKYRVRGTLRGQGHGTLMVDFVPRELKVEPGEKLYTSGDDRIFPRGMPVGEIKAVKDGRAYKDIFVAPSGFLQGLDEVLIVLEGVHQPVPAPANEQMTQHLQSAPKDEKEQDPAGAKAMLTDADTLRDQYRRGTRWGAPNSAAKATDSGTVQAAPPVTPDAANPVSPRQ